MPMNSEVPAVDLADHARAVLEDDRRLGIERRDPVLSRLAKGSDKHSAPCLCVFLVNETFSVVN